MKTNKYCVIMAGGSGNKFWPISRDSKPKQFLDIVGNEQSFIKETFDRFAKLVPKENILVVTLARYKDTATKLLPDLLPENLLLEPYSRNTAPCITFAACKLLKRNPNAVMAASPADHRILDEDKFLYAINSALEYADKEDALMTIGIVPTKPETNYGYIQVSGKDRGNDRPLKVKTFTEKPDKTLAEIFYKSGEFYWNSGIFAWKAQTIMEEMKRLIPDVASVFNGWENALDTEKEKDFLEKVYSECPKISIDYGVMEKTDRAWLFPGHFGWSDLDSWDTLYKVIDGKDKNGNLIFAPQNLTQDDSGSLVISRNKKKLYVLKGLKDYMVIDTEDALMICPRNDEDYQDIISDLGMPDYEDFR
ncbi:MAG: mannose-1-phosphate guanylyltransferase [Bacteroidales bacterium]|jgi:mannose-1-phosphate guanylyltransferase|nr:mannose-1-phosphate guanylyltransferase [Bacteroidales bacterium]